MIVGRITCPHIASRDRQYRDWRVVGKSLLGRAHSKLGIVCQDHSGSLQVNGCIALCAADGAGSAPFSHIGSAIAVRKAIQTILSEYRAGSLGQENGNRGWLQLDFAFGTTEPADVLKIKMAAQRALSAATLAVIKEAKKMGVESKNLATTLLLVIAGSDFVCAAQTGDGAVVIDDENSKLISLTKPVHGEFVNQTIFITSLLAGEHTQIRFHKGRPRNIAVFTDGLQMLALKMGSGEPHEGFFIPLFQYVAQHPQAKADEGLRRFLTSEEVMKRTDDDLTLLVATQGQGNGSVSR
jgi:Protein phosphatase 2C